MDLREVGMKIETGLILLRIGPMASLCEGGNEPPGSLKARTGKGCLRIRFLGKFLGLGVKLQENGESYTTRTARIVFFTDKLNIKSRRLRWGG
ncbi:hypothetical protein ANN_12178 [Periplaneta americana]|uniref:Per a allergen n=1 Tax=Periplaneta americana TaxID=6978 RepID=A0ABQ8T8X2_PERAM|nr:hypothetical protein ANN_12178 [Periplaneta americana]